MKNFKHINAESIDHALSILKTYEGRAVLIAGGTDLLGILKGDVLPSYPEALINLKTVPNLDTIEETESGVRIGAMVKLADVIQSPVIQKLYPILAEAAESVASPEIRNMGTLGGNLCQETRCWYYRYPHHMGGRIQCLRKGKGPCLAIRGDNRYHAIMGGKKCFAVCPSDMAVAFGAMGARLRVAGQAGEREIPVTEFYNTLGTALKPDEMLTEIHVSRPPAKARQTYIKFRIRDSIDFAIVSIASMIKTSKGVCQDARIILGGVAPFPHRAMEAEEIVKGKIIDIKEANKAADASVEQAKPLSQNGYKVEITRNLIRRALI